MDRWIMLESLPQWEEVIQQSYTQPIAVFKHSTRCSVSSMVWRSLRYALEADAHPLPFYFLDLIAHRDISDRIAHSLAVVHESPQLILIDHGQVSYHAAHAAIDYAVMCKAALK